MTKPVFPWLPDLGAQKSIKPAVHQIKFGDSYELRAAQGINFKPRTWAVRFTKSQGEAMQISDFLEARGAVESFTWTDPDDKSGTYVCREWSQVKIGVGVYTISGTFEQVFEY